MFTFLLFFFVSYLSVVLAYFCHLTRNDTHDISIPFEWEQSIAQTFYINLDRHSDRRNYMEKATKAREIICERYPAVDGLSEIEEYPEVDLTPNQLGRKLSHLNLLSGKKSRGWTVVFEDTVNLENTSIPIILEEVPSSTQIVQFGIDPLYLLMGILTFQFVRHTSGIWSTKRNISYPIAYAINSAGAKKWATSIERNFFQEPLERHRNGIEVNFFCHTLSSFLDFFKLFALRDFSLIQKVKPYDRYMFHPS